MSGNAEEKTTYHRTLSTLFASFSVMAFGVLSLLNSFSMDFYSVIYMLSIVIPASILLGLIGYAIGIFFDNPDRFRKRNTRIQTIDNAYKIQSMFASEADEEKNLQNMFHLNNESESNE